MVAALCSNCKEWWKHGVMQIWRWLHWSTVTGLTSNTIKMSTSNNFTTEIGYIWQITQSQSSDIWQTTQSQLKQFSQKWSQCLQWLPWQSDLCLSVFYQFLWSCVWILLINSQVARLTSWISIKMIGVLSIFVSDILPFVAQWLRMVFFHQLSQV